MTQADRVHSTPTESTSALSPDNPPLRAADSALGGLYVPTGIAPETLFQAIGRLRQEAQDEIDRLLAFLDAIDGDADLEPGLGFPEVTHWNSDPSDPGVSDDREEDADYEDGDHDSTGVMGPALNQDKRRDQYEANIQARKLLRAKRQQLRARKAARQVTEGRTHA